MQYLWYKGVRIRYKVCGNTRGETVLLMPASEAWHPGLIDTFAARGLQMVCIGGQETMDGSEDTSETISPDALAVLDALGVERFHVAGQFSGGRIAQELMIYTSDRVKSMTLFGASPIAVNKALTDERVFSEIPVAIFHGAADREVPSDAAMVLHRRYRNAELHIFPYIGHELPRLLWDAYADGLARTVQRAKCCADSRE